MVESCGLTKGNIRLNTSKNWIVETHSEAILLRILKEIREGNFPSQMLRVYYVDKKPGRPSTLDQLLVSETGELISQWPEGFFSNDIDEIF